MAGIQKHPKSGVYQFRKRVPDKLRDLVGATEVWRSLATKDPAEAKTRWLKVAAETEARWANLKRGEQSLDHRQAHALAGDFYRWRVAQDEEEPGSAVEWRLRIRDQC